MKLSAPIYSLKRLAKSISRTENIPLHTALDRVAHDEGFLSWSLLASKYTSKSIADYLLDRTKPGELVLLGARPGHGKTRMGVEIVANSTKTGNHGWFFTLEWNKSDVEEQLNNLGALPLGSNVNFHFDRSDSISADHIINSLYGAESGSVAVIDYLQLLDQKRTNPALSIQVNQLRAFAQQNGVIILCLSQVDRSFENAGRQVPTLSDVRLPNPLDLQLFDNAYFLHNGNFESA